MRWRVSIWLLVAAVAFAGCSGKGGSKSAYKDVPGGDAVIAKVGGDEIRGSDLDYRIKISNQKLYTDYKNAHNWRMILDTMIEQKLLADEAEKKGLTRDPEFLERMEIAKVEILNNMYIRKVVNEEAAPTEEELRKAYEEGKESLHIKESARVSHILLKSREEAETTRRELLSGAKWDALANLKSMDEKTKRTNGVLGWITANDVIQVIGTPVPELLPAAMATEVDGISQPVESAMGWHVLKVHEKRESGMLTFEDVAPNIKERMTNTRARETYPKRIQELREAADVVVYEDKFQEFMTGPLGEKDLFDLAQKSKDPREKIGYYQQIVTKHGDGGFADKAQFMIGFTYSEEMKDYDSAEKAFRAVVDKYPQSELAESAKWMLENMRNQDIPHLPEGAAGAGVPPAQKGS